MEMKIKLLLAILLLSISGFAQIQNHGIFYGISIEKNGLLNGLDHLWELDETTGTTAYDSYGSNNLTNSGATINQTGVIGTSYYLTSNDRLQGSRVDLSSNEITVSVWASVNTSSYGALVSQRNGATVNNFQFYNYNSDRTKCVVLIWGTTVISYVSSTGYFDNNTWGHYAFTYDGSTMNLYKNGSLYDTYSLSSTMNNTTGSVLRIGDDFYSHYITSYIDQVGIWHVAKTATDIEALYNSGSGIAYIYFTAWIKPFYDNLLDRKYNIETPYRIAA